ncbi:hypothetical protein [Aminivibrio sp.]|uniref:hypothetical protein n=1 Tax=Aminivibrio sp. TaxID=1872489 RepID=UPI00345E4DAE
MSPGGRRLFPGAAHPNKLAADSMHILSTSLEFDPSIAEWTVKLPDPPVSSASDSF